jgi:arabinofuranosyltransferase
MPRIDECCSGRAATAERFALWVVVCVYAVVLVRTAWLDDDCFITLRVVDNLVNGYGLRWNRAERVQVFTHPLWLFMISAVYFFTREAFFTTVALSMSVSLMALVIYVRCVAITTRAAILGAIVFLMSQSYVEYSTSGLENPLTHLLLVLFLWRYKSFSGQARELFWLTLVGGLLALNRDDLLLLVVPVLLFAYGRTPKVQGALMGAIGALPLVCWKAFSVVYYGFFFPNTAYAKLDTGMPRGVLLVQGIEYFHNQLLNDPVSLSVIALMLASLFTRNRRRFIGPCVGVTLYLSYVVCIGGCFMLGRFFTAPLVVSVAALGAFTARLPNKVFFPLAAAMIAVGLLVPKTPPIITGGDYGKKYTPTTVSGVVNERRYYYQGNGLLPNLGTPPPHPRHAFINLGLSVRDRRGVFVISASGLAGYFAGPKVHLVDMFALCDPLLARLPSRQDVRIGHFERMLPEGYLETLGTGRDHFKDRALAEYYSRMATITRGPLFTMERWRAIRDMHLGKYDHLINKPFYARGYVPETHMRDLEKVGNRVLPFNRTLISPKSGLKVAIDGVAHSKWLDASLDPEKDYFFTFINGGEDVGFRRMTTTHNSGSVPYRVPIPVPEAAWGPGYDELLIEVKGRRDGAIGHLRLAPGYAEEVRIGQLSTPFANGAYWLAPGAVEIIPGAPLRVRLGAVSHAARLKIALDHNDEYLLELCKGEEVVASMRATPPRLRQGGLSGFVLEVPTAAVEAGYDEIRVSVVRGDGFNSIGHLILAE